MSRQCHIHSLKGSRAGLLPGQKLSAAHPGRGKAGLLFLQLLSTNVSIASGIQTGLLLVLGRVTYIVTFVLMPS
jgi:hypothetical protein